MNYKIIYLSLFILIIGCAPQSMYYWGNYSNTLYKYKKDATPIMLDKHKVELLNIIRISNNRGVNVPPGVNAEYGYILLLQGQKDEALSYLLNEKKTYPESAKFIDDLLNNINKDN